jgi:hypothetical protein
MQRSRLGVPLGRLLVERRLTFVDLCVLGETAGAVTLGVRECLPRPRSCSRHSLLGRLGGVHRATLSDAARP